MSSDQKRKGAKIDLINKWAYYSTNELILFLLPSFAIINAIFFRNGQEGKREKKKRQIVSSFFSSQRYTYMYHKCC
jgi:hypothetical protein